MAANVVNSILQKRSRDQNLKNNFPKRFFQWYSAQSKKTWKDLHYWNEIWKKKQKKNSFCHIL